MRELVYEICVRPVGRGSTTWEAFAPDLPEFHIFGYDCLDTWNLAKSQLGNFVAEKMSRGEEISEPLPLGSYMKLDFNALWLIACVRLGPLRCNEERVLFLTDLPEDEPHSV